MKKKFRALSRMPVGMSSWKGVSEASLRKWLFSWDLKTEKKIAKQRAWEEDVPGRVKKLLYGLCQGMVKWGLKGGPPLKRWFGCYSFTVLELCGEDSWIEKCEKKKVVKCEKNEGRVMIKGWKPGKGQNMWDLWILTFILKRWEAVKCF